MNVDIYQRFDHPAVYTCEESDRLCPKMPGSGTKNLFLRDNAGKRHFLVVVEKDKSVDLKKLKEIIGVSKLGFASEERLKKHLGLTPGSVTLLGLVNDSEGKALRLFWTGWGTNRKLLIFLSET
jgi:Ala-tRNA(Pro) deacylase